MVNVIKGDLIKLALEGKFDVIGHGCNCFCSMGAGIAVPMAKTFGCDNFPMENVVSTKWEDDEWISYNLPYKKGDINKLGQIDYKKNYIWLKHPSGKPHAMNSKTVGQKDVLDLIVVNMYTQYEPGGIKASPYGIPLDYDALMLCLRKMNWLFKGKKIGLPWIGCGLAGGDKDEVKDIIRIEMEDCEVTIVEFD